MRCSTVSGLLLVAAAAAGGLLLGVVCAATGPSEPAIRAAPARDAMATEGAKGVNRFVMRCFLCQRSGYAALGCRGPAARRGTPRAQNRFQQNSSPKTAKTMLWSQSQARAICARDQGLGARGGCFSGS